MNQSITTLTNLKTIVADIFSSLNLKLREHPQGRKPALTNVEGVTAAIWKQKQNIESKKSLFEIVEPSCKYNAFVRAINAAGKYLALIIGVITALLEKSSCTLKFTDATDMPVCLYKNAGHHHTMQGVAAYAKTGKGPFFGLKLHLSADVEGRIIGLRITPANSSDRTIFTKMNAALRGLFVADAGYVGEEFTRGFYIEGERMVLTATRCNMKKIATVLQIALLNLRMKIETHFRSLKLCYGLVTSLPRSAQGYLTHYLAAIAAHLLTA